MNTELKVTPKDFFLWVTAMAALYVSLGSMITLLFEYIERLVGDATFIGYDPYSGGIRFAIASLIVIFPLYIYFTRKLNQEMRAEPAKKDLWVRRWLIFLLLFVSGIALVVDLIVLVNTFLSGQALTASFLLKVLAVLLLVGAVFYYYYNDIKGKWETQEKLSKRIGMGVSLFVLVTIVGGFFIMGSPQTQRELQYDRERVDNLRSLQFAVTDYYQNKQALPSSIEDLRDPLIGRYIETDPATGEEYGYRVVDATTFELCATFSADSPRVESAATRGDYRLEQIARDSTDWGHGTGKTCFEREIDPDNYPPQKVPLRF